MAKIRSPIVTVLGHVDHGKTTLLDKIRGTAVAKTEPGLITQYISASYMPTETIKKVCGRLLEAMKLELTIPGLLWIDSPGHEAFTTLRKRGGAIADIAVLVIDINEGFQPQTVESIMFLKQLKTPFVVAATKIDKTTGWSPKPDSAFIASFNEQSVRAQDEFETKLYRLVGQLGMKGFEAERYDRVKDWTKQICIVPVSGITGEGIPDLLMILAGLAQKYLKDRLEVKPGEGKGTVLEVKEFRGLGTTIDVILYDGEIRRGDWLVVGGKEVIETRIKAILEPNPLKELKAEKAFSHVESVVAAAGLKIAAPGLEKAIPGSPLRAVREKKDLEKIKSEVQQEVSEVEFETDREGIAIKADTLGSLEAIIKCLKDMGLPIRSAHAGTISRSDVMGLKILQRPVVFAFGVQIPDDIRKLAQDNNVKIFSSNVIYKILEDYKLWEAEKKKAAETELLEKAIRPARVKALKGYVFRQSNPALFGVEVLKGVLKAGCRLVKNGKTIGEVKEIQKEGKNIQELKSGDRAAVSMPDVTVGKEVREGDVLDVFLSEYTLGILRRIRHKLNEDELELLEEATNA